MVPPPPPSDNPTLQVIDAVSGKWTALIVYLISEKPMRTSELQRMAQGITQKVLTQTLRSLERDGVVTRKVYPVVPPQVEYSLTPLGMSLVKILANLCNWARDHYPEVKKARVKYDNRPEGNNGNSVALDGSDATL